MVDIRSLDDEAADIFAAAYTRGITSIADVRDHANWTSATEQTLKCMADQLTGQSLLPEPIVERPPWASAAVIGSLAKSAAFSASRTGERRGNGQVTATVAQAVRPLLEKLAVREYLQDLVNVELSPEVVLSALVYDSPGAYLKLHLDTRSFGDVIALLCLDRDTFTPGADASATVTVSADTISHTVLTPGECLVMDGPCTPHGRSPLGPDERVTLLLMAYRVQP
jgi:hypothetical protein